MFLNQNISNQNNRNVRWSQFSDKWFLSYTTILRTKQTWNHNLKLKASLDLPHVFFGAALATATAMASPFSLLALLSADEEPFPPAHVEQGSSPLDAASANSSNLSRWWCRGQNGGGPGGGGQNGGGPGGDGGGGGGQYLGRRGPQSS